MRIVTPERTAFSSRLLSIFQVFATRGTARVTRQKTEDENPDEEEDDRVNGDLEGEHGDRPSSVTATASYGA